jgi:hypothetical protein
VSFFDARLIDARMSIDGGKEGLVEEGAISIGLGVGKGRECGLGETGMSTRLSSGGCINTGRMRLRTTPVW